MMVALVVELFLTPALMTTTKIITLWDLVTLKLGPKPHKQIPMFAGLRPLQARVVVLMARLSSLARGGFLARRGELKPELYVLLSGQVEVRRDDRVICTMGRGDVVGEMGSVRGEARSADVVATEDVEYVALDEQFLTRLKRRYPRIAATVFLNLAKILSGRLESTTDLLEPGRPREKKESV